MVERVAPQLQKVEELNGLVLKIEMVRLENATPISAAARLLEHLIRWYQTGTCYGIKGSTFYSLHGAPGPARSTTMHCSIFVP